MVIYLCKKLQKQHNKQCLIDIKITIPYHLTSLVNVTAALLYTVESSLAGHAGIDLMRLPRFFLLRTDSP